MNSLLYLYLTLFLFVHTTSNAIVLTTVQQQTCTSPVDIEDTCKGIAAGNQPGGGVNYDFCMKSLKAITSSSSPVDLHELATIATRLAISHATSTEAKIEELMELETDSAAKACLETCLDVYSEVVDRMNDALDNLAMRIYPRAMALLGPTIVINGMEKCEDGFKKAKVPCPLMAMDKDYGKFASITHGIVTSLE